MTEVGIRALKQNASAVVALAAAGERITVTDRGRPVVEIVALPSTPMKQLLGSGRARPPRRRLSELPPPEPGPDLSAALSEMREADKY